MFMRSHQLAWGLTVGLQFCLAGPVLGQAVDVLILPASQTVNVSDTVNIEARITTNGLDVCTGGVFVQFDNALLSFVSGTNNTATWNSGLLNVEPAENQPGIISLNAGAASAVNGSNILVSTLTFTAISPGTSAL